MRFGKIEYLNLLPFDVFIKRYPTTSGFKKFLEVKKSYPANLNRNFLRRRIDAGFISSIAGYSFAQRRKMTKAGIIAKGEVWSVIVIPTKDSDDYQSASSNALAKVLGVSGEVLIGDRALQYKIAGGGYIDLGLKWWERHHLGFSFGRMCVNSHWEFYEKLANAFIVKRVKIPHYILTQRVKQNHISREDILRYLDRIHYRVGYKEELALKRFYSALRLKRIKRPKRFS